MRELGWNVVWITTTRYKRNRRFKTEEEALAYCENLKRRVAKGDVLAYKCVKERPLAYYLQKENIMKHYFINGWPESRSYFMSIGHFTEEEVEYMEYTGEEIKRWNNVFRIETE